MTYTYACDVSVYQTVSDWAGIASRFDLIIARASIALGTDTRFLNHIKKAKSLSKMTGAYHFNSLHDLSPEAQADLFCKQIDAAGGVDFPFLDVEGTGKMTKAQATRFIKRMHANGKLCGLYMSASQYYWAIGQDYDWIASWSLNNGKPGTPPKGDWEFWQYTSNGKSSDGSRMDLDVFNGTLAQMKALAAGGGANTVAGLSINYDVTHDKNPYDALGTAKVRTDGSRKAYKIADGQAMALSNGLSLGVVQKAVWIDDGNTASVVTNIGGEAYVIRMGAVDYTPLPAPVAPAPDCNAAVAAAVAPLNAKIAALTDDVAAANEAVKAAEEQAATAAQDEKGRIAAAVGAAEAAKIEAI